MNNPLTAYTRPSWDEFYMALALVIAMRSPDSSTRHGSILVDGQHKILGIGFNGMPRGCDDSQYPLDRDEKLKYVVHSEPNCLINSRLSTEPHDDYTLYVTGPVCLECMKQIIQYGIKRVVYGKIRSRCINEKDNALAMDFAKQANVSMEECSIDPTELLATAMNYYAYKLDNI